MKEQLSGRREQAVNQIIGYLSSKTSEEIGDILGDVPVQPQAGGKSTTGG